MLVSLLPFLATTRGPGARAVAELGFRRNDLARSLRSGRTTATIGLIIEDLANPFYSTIASAAAEVAREHDTLLITASSEENPARERQLLLDLCDRRVDGLLVTDEQIVAARRLIWDRYRIVVEHGTAAAMAALVAGAYRPVPGERLVVLLCGANTNPGDLGA